MNSVITNIPQHRCHFNSLLYSLIVNYNKREWVSTILAEKDIINFGTMWLELLENYLSNSNMYLYE